MSPRLLLGLSALAVTAHGQDSVVFRPPVFTLGANNLPDISGGRESRPWGDHAAWDRGYAPCSGDNVNFPAAATPSVLSALGVDGLPYAATIGEEEFHASGITFEGLDSGIEFLADGGIFFDEEPAAAEDCVPPTTTAPPTPPPTTAAITCPRNCGTAANSGGTCRTNGRCTSCNANRVLQGGRCYNTISCKGRRIQTGSQTGSGCRCENTHCHFCTRVASGDTCRVCRDGWYLLDGDCVESCPSQFASSGVGQFKRRCADPFTCQSARLLVSPPVNYGCKCATEDNTAIADCQICEHRAGEHGQHCLKCNAGMFLWENRCERDNCDGLAGMIEYAPSQYGRECRAPFTCIGRSASTDGGSCKCPASVGRNNCAVCEYSIAGTACNRCTNGKYLRNGNCIDACRDGEESVGEGSDGRECQ